MRPVRIPDAESTFVQPSNWNDAGGHCSPLAVKSVLDGGFRYLTSAWEPEGDEAGLLLAGGKVNLGLSLARHPVTRMSVDDVPMDGPPVLYVEQIAVPNHPHALRVTVIIPPREGRTILKSWCDVDLTDTPFAAAVACGIKYIETALAAQGMTMSGPIG